MSSTPFGEHLKREREMRGVSLEEISAATRISTRFLEAIEKEQWDQLPGGVFNRGFIRSIGRFLGLDEDNLVAAYALQTAAGTEAAIAAKRTQDVPKNWQPAAIAVVALALVIVGGWFAYHHYRAEIEARFHGRITASTVNSSNEPSPVVPAVPGDAAATVPPVEATPPLATAADPDLTLKVEASRPADVKIVADGKAVYQGPLVTSEAMHFAARDTFNITTSESSALQLELDGQAIPAFGTPGQPGQLSLTRNDLKPAAGATH